MKAKTTRLFFIDAIRAWAILMMLQGHFIDGLLDPIFRDSDNMVFSTWLYFRGITAPVFFTVSGFIFTYLLLRAPQLGKENPRVRKGIRRGFQLLLIGYLLRMNLLGMLQGEVYDAFYLVDVLHCIGLSLLSIIGIYVFSSKRPSYVFPSLLLMTTLLLFVFEPIYKQWSFDFLPYAIANYFTKVNGSVFTIIPWLGYASIGAFVSVLFNRFKTYKHLYPAAIGIFLAVGASLIFLSSPAFVNLFKWTGILLFKQIELNNYLFIRLGDVFVVFALFMLAQAALKHKTILKIGSNTLSIYVIHFIILYGSFTGLGLYRFFDHSLSPVVAIPGAIAFMVVCTGLALQYDKREQEIKTTLQSALLKGISHVVEIWKTLVPIFREVFRKGRNFIFKLVRPQRS